MRTIDSPHKITPRNIKLPLEKKFSAPEKSQNSLFLAHLVLVFGIKTAFFIILVGMPFKNDDNILVDELLCHCHRLPFNLQAQNPN